MKKTLLASAMAVAFSLSSAAFAADDTQVTALGNNTNSNSTGDALASAARSAAVNNGSTGTFQSAFNTSNATATSSLTGAVTGNTVYSLGNIANGGGAGGPALFVGGPGGSSKAHAGKFSMDNTMHNVGQSAAGILVANQNSGIAALVQQSVNVQANLAVGK